MAAVSLVVLDGPAPTLEELIARVERVLPSTPRFGAVLGEVPFRLERPVWVPVNDLSIGDHVHAQPLDRPGDDRELARLVERLLCMPFDPNRPRWELRLVEGLSGGRSAVAARVHLALIDEMTAVDMLSCVLAP